MWKKLKSTQNKKKECLRRSERDNLYIKVVDQLLTPFIKMAFLFIFSKYVLLLSRTRDFP